MMPTMVPEFASAEPPSPTVTPLPPPPVPPRDASGISGTTPPLEAVSPGPRPTTPEMLWLADGDASTVAIEVHGGVPYVPVVVNGERREFLLSTVRPSAVDQSLAGGAAGALSVRTLQVGDVRLTGVRVTSARLVPFSQTYLGVKAEGVLGSEFFGHYPITIDYPNRKMTIFRDERAALSARAAGETRVPLQLVGGGPAIHCTVDGAYAAPCVIDVGSDSEVMLSPAFGEARRMLRAGPSLSDMREAEPEREMTGRMARAQSLSIGSLMFDRPLVRLPNEFAASPGGGQAGTHIGSGILAKFVVSIDVPGGSFALTGAPDATAESAFDRSGLWLVLRNGAVTVRSVLRGSPAESAGLRGGDLIVSIDGQAAQDLDLVRSQLTGNTGERLEVVYLRGGQRRGTTLMLRNII